MDYKVDIVMCIDITGSMQDCIDTVKNRALQFWPDLQDALKAASKNVSDVRVKVIGFRDFEADGSSSLQESRYFNLSDQGSSDPEEYKQFVSNLVADGGGDEPENSLSAENQIKLKKFIEDSTRFYNCQFIISTHSPFLLNLLEAKIYDLDSNPVETKKWTELNNVKIYHEFFKEHESEFE